MGSPLQPCTAPRKRPLCRMRCPSPPASTNYQSIMVKILSYWPFKGVISADLHSLHLLLDGFHGGFGRVGQSGRVGSRDESRLTEGVQCCQAPRLQLLPDYFHCQLFQKTIPQLQLAMWELSVTGSALHSAQLHMRRAVNFKCREEIQGGIHSSPPFLQIKECQRFSSFQVVVSVFRRWQFVFFLQHYRLNLRRFLASLVALYLPLVLSESVSQLESDNLSQIVPF